MLTVGSLLREPAFFKIFSFTLMIIVNVSNVDEYGLILKDPCSFLYIIFRTIIGTSTKLDSLLSTFVRNLPQIINFYGDTYQSWMQVDVELRHAKRVSHNTED